MNPVVPVLIVAVAFVVAVVIYLFLSGTWNPFG
jgi:hypothetical protein